MSDELDKVFKVFQDLFGAEAAIQCVQCKGPVEAERLAYVHPTCLACLPPPPPIPTRPIKKAPFLRLIQGGKGVPVPDASGKKEKKMGRPTTVRRVEWYLGPDSQVMPDELDKYENQGDWVLEPKHDGMWCMLQVLPDGTNLLKSRDARTPSITGSNADGLDKLATGLPPGTVLVGELEASTQAAKDTVDTKGYRSFHVFDMPQYGAVDMRSEVWSVRRTMLTHVLAQLHESELLRQRLPLTPTVVRDFRKAYDEMTAAGMEGIVLKRIDSTYRTARSDGKTNVWLRCKKWVTEDYVLMGVTLTPGGAYGTPQPTGIWGLYDKTGRLTPVLQASCKPKELMQDTSKWGVLVAEFQGALRFKSGSLRHAQFVRFREDKMPEDCVL